MVRARCSCAPARSASGARTAGSQRGILSTHIHAQGTLGDILYVDGAVGQPDKPGHLVMNGREVFRHAVIRLAEAVEEALAANGLTRADVDWLVPHQANRRIIDAMGRKLGLPPERVVVTVDRHANTSAASVPLALAEAGGTVASAPVISFCWRRSGVAWPGARRWFACDRLQIDPQTSDPERFLVFNILDAPV